MARTSLLDVIYKCLGMTLIVLCAQSIPLSVFGFCSIECECSTDQMLCKDGGIPARIPVYITELYVETFDFNNLNKSLFQDVQNIKKLDIKADAGETIPPASFVQFQNLTYLGLHGEELTFISPDAFVGLNKLLELNLSSNPVLQIDQISRALDSHHNGLSRELLPNLSSISVARIQTAFIFPVILDGYFFRSVSGRRQVKHLDISDLNILGIDLIDFQPLCKSVEFVDIKRSIVGSVTNYFRSPACGSLRSFDVSDIILPLLRTKFTFQYYDRFSFFCETFHFFLHLETFLANNLITEFSFEVNDYFLDMSKCPFKIKKISIAGNKFRKMNMTVRLHEVTIRYLSELNFSNNALEYISPSVLLPSENIRILDFSNNKLNVMLVNHTDDFERLFWAQKNLRHLNLSKNGLVKIPMFTFSYSTKLKVLDISHNKIKHLDFSVEQFVKMEKLDVSYNMIVIIEPTIRMELKMLLVKTSNNTDAGNDTFHVSLEGNPFQCTCENVNLEFIEWIHSTKLIDGTEKITCVLNENPIEIRRNGLAETKHFCRIQTFKKIAAISTPIVMLSIALSLSIIIFIRRRHRRKGIIRRVIAQIENGTFPLPYLVFLSHCSEDTDLAINKLYPDLGKHLSEMTRSDKELVCIGDKHFRPGFIIREEIMRCVSESSVFVAVVSRDFCQSNWCNLEIGEAYDQNKPIIMLMAEVVDERLMNNFLRKMLAKNVHASWKQDGNGGHIEPNWNIFCKAIIQQSGKILQTKNHAKHDDETEV